MAAGSAARVVPQCCWRVGAVLCHLQPAPLGGAAAAAACAAAAGGSAARGAAAAGAAAAVLPCEHGVLAG